MRTPLPTLLARIALRPAHLSRTATFSPLSLSSNNKFVITRTMSAASASTSTSRGRSPTRVPGPVETTIQQKVRFPPRFTYPPEEKEKADQDFFFWGIFNSLI